MLLSRGHLSAEIHPSGVTDVQENQTVASLPRVLCCCILSIENFVRSLRTHYVGIIFHCNRLSIQNALARARAHTPFTQNRIFLK